MEELIFFAVIIFFSIIESIARSRKKRSGSPEIPPEGEEPDRDWGAQQPTRTGMSRTASRSQEPTYDPGSYDADPSYDDVETEEAAASRDASPRYSEPYGTTSGAGRTGSEGMVPADIWEEIAGLAQGRMRQLEAKVEKPPPVSAKPATPKPAARDGWGKRGPKVGQAHKVHLAHAGYGTDPSSRAPSEQDGLDPLARRLSADQAAVREQLRRRGHHGLRQAVILQDILGPPASMRADMLSD
jgi:hypothetical protein